MQAAAQEASEVAFKIFDKAQQMALEIVRRDCKRGLGPNGSQSQKSEIVINFNDGHTGGASLASLG
jgi:hypothetical protein